MVLCKICGLEEKDCPMLNGEMSMYMCPKEIKGTPNRPKPKQTSL